MDDKAMKGWLAADPPPPPRTYIPGEERKWYKMMGKAEAQFSHLGPRDTPFRQARRDALDEHVAEIQTEQEEKNAELAARPVKPTRLTLAPRYAKD